MQVVQKCKLGHIDVGDNNAATTRHFGPIAETAPDSGIFEADIPIRYTDGPASRYLSNYYHLYWSS